MVARTALVRMGTLVQGTIIAAMVTLVKEAAVLTETAVMVKMMV